jgi:hypothetical protein
MNHEKSKRSEKGNIGPVVSLESFNHDIEVSLISGPIGNELGEILMPLLVKVNLVRDGILRAAKDRPQGVLVHPMDTALSDWLVKSFETPAKGFGKQ